MKNKTCCFSGHRVISQGQVQQIKKQLYTEIEKMIQGGVQYFGNGGALGFDTMAAQIIIELKKQHPAIRLIMVLPCRNQDINWKPADRQRFRDILAQADKIVYVSEKYYPGCMQKRNRYLVDNSAHCICYLQKNSGGTAYTVRYAQQLHLNIIRIAQKIEEPAD